MASQAQSGFAEQRLSRPVKNSPVPKAAPNWFRLRELLEYDLFTGKFKWRKKRSGVASAGAVGNIFGMGYRRITIDRVSYLAHRLAWYYITGEWVSGDIDHINGKKDDNRIVNLRPATRGQNHANRGARRIGLKGVYFHKAKKKWHARINVEKKAISLGYYATELEAHNAYATAARRYHGEFARIA